MRTRRLRIRREAQVKAENTLAASEPIGATRKLLSSNRAPIRRARGAIWRGNSNADRRRETPGLRNSAQSKSRARSQPHETPQLDIARQTRSYSCEIDAIGLSERLRANSSSACATSP